jgi:hypothetical protein
VHIRLGGAELEAAAKALGMSVDELTEKLSDGTTTIADVAEQEGVELDTVKAAMLDEAEQRIDDVVNQPWPKFERDGRGPGGGKGHAFAGPLGADLDALAKTLGLSVDELRTQLRDGKSIADIAKAQGVEIDTVIDQLVASATSKLDEAVKNGRLTQEKADAIEAKLREGITAMVNGEGPKMFGGHGWRRGPGRPEMPGPPDAPAPPDVPDAPGTTAEPSALQGA